MTRRNINPPGFILNSVPLSEIPDELRLQAQAIAISMALEAMEKPKPEGDEQ